MSEQGSAASMYQGPRVEAATTVERFWCARDGAYALDDHGFLRDPDVTWFGTQSANPGALRTKDLRDLRCLVLLGEPGAGKSTIAGRDDLLVAAGVPIVRFDLAAYGSEDRLVRDVFDNVEVTSWARSTGELCMILDSVDEARARIPQVGTIIAEGVSKLPCSRLFLRLACRTADWLPGLEQSLAAAFDAVAVVEILPLRRIDAAAIAANWCDASALLDEVEHAGAGPLAARPLTLRFLARTFTESGTLPDRGASLYASGIRSLCEEQNNTRRDAGLNGSLTLDERVAVARRIAAATVFGGVSAVWTGLEIEADAENITVNALTGSEEPMPVGTVDVTVDAVREVARTGLFTSRGGQRLGWAHATFADFLAAEWVIVNRLSKAQAQPLFLGADGRCWPQTRLAAAWAVAIAPEMFGFLTTADPAAFQGEVELPESLRSTLIDSLFAVANTLTAAPLERSYRGLRHRDIADQLRPRLRDADPDCRRLALELAADCAAVELRYDLSAIVLDTAAETQDRTAAGWALSRLDGQHRTAALRPLALDAMARGDHQMDELKGVALLASWPQAMSTSEVFSVLTRGRKRNFYGAYSMFIDRFSSDLTTADIDAGLNWLLGDLAAPATDISLGTLANRVLELAATRGAEQTVVEAFTQVAIARAKDYQGLLFEDFRGDQHGDVLADPALRRKVATAVITADQTDRVLLLLSDHNSHSLGVVRADDLAWLADLYADVDPELREAVRSLFQWTFDLRVPQHRDLVLDMPRYHPLHADLVHAWVDPVALASPEVDQMRRSWGSIQGPKPFGRDDDDVNTQIEDLLDQFDNGEAVGFWHTTHLLTVAPGAKHFGPEFDPDLTAMPRWSTLSNELQGRIVEAAEQYLLSQACQPEEWLEMPDIRYYPAEAGYRAMVLLLRVAPERLDRLPRDAWKGWAAIVATWPTGSVSGAKWADKLRLLELVGPDELDAVRTALLMHVEAAVSAGKRPNVENEAGYLWDDSVASTYLRLAREALPEPRTELVATLAACSFDLLRPVLLEWLAGTADGECFRLAASQLIDRDLAHSWPAIKDALAADLAIAQEVLGNELMGRGYKPFDDLPAHVLAEIYLWLRERFPPETDPQFYDAHMVRPREQIGRWRDNLLGRLRDHGTSESVEAVRAIVAALPEDRWLARTLATAEATLRRNQWSPTPLPQLLRLAADHRTALVNDSAALAAAVSDALREIQGRLIGATPESHYLWDTHTRRPKAEDEISDYLANELGRHLVARGAVVNREVQIRRSQPSGIGERTDLFIDAVPLAAPDTGRLSVPVEVKGAWNDEVLTAMRDQLAARYMRDIRTADGVYVVVWPDLDSWTNTTDKRRAKFVAVDRAAVEKELASQASELKQQGALVTVVHLDIAYRRPKPTS